MSDRRLLLTRATKILVLTGLGFVIYPFLAAMLPDSGVDSDRRRQWLREIELSGLQPGELLQIDDWPGGPVAVYRRTPQERDALLIGTRQAREAASHDDTLPADFDGRTRSLLADYFVFIPIDRARGCRIRHLPADAENAWTGGFGNPCTDATYDTAGKIGKNPRKETAEDLRVPGYRLVSKTRIQLLPH